MSFQIAEPDGNGDLDSGTIVTLYPGPTSVAYPDTEFISNVLTSRDGNPIIQRPSEDHRIRSWIWSGYRKALPVAYGSILYRKYEELYNRLINYQYNVRLNATPPKSEYVFVKEDETGELEKLVLNVDTWEKQSDFVRVKILQVSRNILSEGGNAIFPSTTLQFVIDDPNWNTF